MVEEMALAAGLPKPRVAIIETEALNAFATGTRPCLLYTSDAADERSSVDLGGRRIIKKKKKRKSGEQTIQLSENSMCAK